MGKKKAEKKIRKLKKQIAELKEVPYVAHKGDAHIEWAGNRTIGFTINPPEHIFY